MLSVSIETIEQFLREHSIPASFSTHLEEFPLPSHLKLKGMTSQDLVNIALRINCIKTEKNLRKGELEVENHFKWRRWERALFFWVVIFYSFITEKDFPSMVVIFLFSLKKIINF